MIDAMKRIPAVGSKYRDAAPFQPIYVLLSGNTESRFIIKSHSIVYMLHKQPPYLRILQITWYPACKTYPFSLSSAHHAQ
jgi:predicted restriction endonuclease